jgi:RHS repeat-associated protein
LSIAYRYPSTNNDGKIDYQHDNVSGDQVNYTYDALNRLIAAATSDTSEWGQGFTYDGFGNLTAVTTTQGTAPGLSSYGTPDAKGNPATIALPAQGNVPAHSGFDIENRLVSVNSSFIGGPIYYYGYAPGNKSVWKGSWTFTYSLGIYTFSRGTDEITFWSVNGQKLATCNLTTPSTTLIATQSGTNYYFGRKLIKNNNGWVYADRQGSVGKFYPYGQEIATTPTYGTEKFTGYFADSDTGNDYAVNRYMTPSSGRFMTPDPSGSRFANPANPGSWNRYAYVGGDPINRRDARGLDDDDDDDDGECAEGSRASECTGFCQSSDGLEDQPDPECDEGGGGGGAVGGWVGPSSEKGIFQGSVNPALNAPGNILQTEADTVIGVLTALSALQNPECASLFVQGFGGAPDPATFLAAIWNGTAANASFQFAFIGDTLANGGAISSWTNATTSVSGPCVVVGGVPAGGCTSVSITINTNAGTPFNFAGNAQSWAATILHELGDAYEDLFGPSSTAIQYDGNGSPAGTSGDDTALVNAACFNIQ